MAQKVKSSQVLEEMIPVNILWDKVLMIPVSGVIDSKKAQLLMDVILDKVYETSSKVVILDILGVASMDSAVSSHLIKITQACKLMGSKCIVSGISSSVAQTLVHLGVSLIDVSTCSTLKDAVQLAFDEIGCEVVFKKP